MADSRCGRCYGVGAVCLCSAGVLPAAEGAACIDCGVVFRRGEVHLEIAIARLTGRHAAVFPQCLGCAAYEQVLHARLPGAVMARRRGA